MKIKVCGMKYEKNMLELGALHPDYIGFLFYSGSKRFVDAKLPEIDREIEKIGVFVNQEEEEVAQRVLENQLDGVQLHGDETPVYIEKLKAFLTDIEVKIIKAFPVGESMDWDLVKPYETVCDYFLFDTKGKDKGGNGIQFDWNLLADYPLNKEYFLSGGIGPEDLDAIRAFQKSDGPDLCHAIDVNSRFEQFPGMKEIKKLERFIKDFKATQS